MRKSHKILGVAAAVGIVLAAGSAFTDSNTAPADKTLGYSSTTVSGGTVNDIDYNLNAAGTNVDSVVLVLAGDTTASAVAIGLNGAATTSCGTGVFATSATTYTCDNAGANFVQSTVGLTSTAVVIN